MSDEAGGQLDLKDRAYKALFLLYAPTFLGYVIFSVVSWLLLTLLGLKAGTAALICVGAVMIMTILYWSWRLIVALVNWRHRRRSRNPFAQVIEQDCELRFLDDNNVAYRVRWKFRAKKEGLDHFICLVSWNGRLDDVVIVEEFGCSCEIQQPADEVGTIIQAKLKNTLLKGQVVTIAVHLLFDTTNNKIGEFIRFVGDYIAEEKVSLQLTLEEGRTARFRRCCFRHPTATRPLLTETDETPSGTGTYLIRRPAQGLSYRLSVE